MTFHAEVVILLYLSTARLVVTDDNAPLEKPYKSDYNFLRVENFATFNAHALTSCEEHKEQCIKFIKCIQDCPDKILFVKVKEIRTQLSRITNNLDVTNSLKLDEVNACVAMFAHCLALPIDDIITILEITDKYSY